MSLLLIQQTLSRFVRLIHLSLVKLLFYFFLLVMAYFIHNLKCQILSENFLQCLSKYHLFLHEQWSCLYPLVLHNHIKINTLQFYLDLVLINLNKQVYSLIFGFFSFLLLINLLWKTSEHDGLFLMLFNLLSFLLLQI